MATAEKATPEHRQTTMAVVYVWFAIRRQIQPSITFNQIGQFLNIIYLNSKFTHTHTERDREREVGRTSKAVFRIFFNSQSSDFAT